MLLDVVAGVGVIVEEWQLVLDKLRVVLMCVVWGIEGMRY